MSRPSSYVEIIESGSKARLMCVMCNEVFKTVNRNQLDNSVVRTLWRSHHLNSVKCLEMLL